MASSDFPQPASFTKTWHSTPYPFISPSRPALSAAGKNVVITGGATGIGQAIAVAFAQAEAKSVAILGRRLDKLQAAAAAISAASPTQSTEVVFEAADVLDRHSIDAALQSVATKVGNVDVLVLNAGVLGQPGPTMALTADNLSQAFAANALGPLNTIHAFRPHAGVNPILLNTTTCLIHMAPVAGLAPYSVSKGAGVKLLDHFAAENPELRLVHVQPGWVATDMNGNQPEAPDVAELPGQFFVWLASPEASFLNGRFVWANWDAQELLERAEEIKGSKLLTVGLEGL